jgi:hypothetical protein
MNSRFWIGWLVVFVLWMAGGYLIHDVMLGTDYAALPNLFRPEADVKEGFLHLAIAHLIMAGAFTWIYSRGVTDRPWTGQGLRFGVAVALLAVVPMYWILHAVQPWPSGLAHKAMLYDSLLVVVVALVLAAIYQRKPAAG